MKEGFYIGNGFNLTYLVTKIIDGYELICLDSRKTHIFHGDKLSEMVNNFTNNHKYICDWEYLIERAELRKC